MACRDRMTSSKPTSTNSILPQSIKPTLRTSLLKPTQASASAQAEVPLPSRQLRSRAYSWYIPAKHCLLEHDYDSASQNPWLATHKRSASALAGPSTGVHRPSQAWKTRTYAENTKHGKLQITCCIEGHEDIHVSTELSLIRLLLDSEANYAWTWSSGWSGCLSRS